MSLLLTSRFQSLWMKVFTLSFGEGGGMRKPGHIHYHQINIPSPTLALKLQKLICCATILQGARFTLINLELFKDCPAQFSVCQWVSKTCASADTVAWHVSAHTCPGILLSPAPPGAGQTRCLANVCWAGHLLTPREQSHPDAGRLRD